MNNKFKYAKTFLIDIMEKWKNGDINEIIVHECVEDFLEKENFQYSNSENNSYESIILEVLSQLDILNRQLICQEDIEAINNFIINGEESPIESWSKWTNYWDNIDYEERKINLSDNPYYISL